MTAAPPPYRISGHESFPCRYTWLPKAVRGVDDNPRLFSDEDQAMVDLGLGKNMVRSARFFRSANLECDFHDPAALSGYETTKNTVATG